MHPGQQLSMVHIAAAGRSLCFMLTVTQGVGTQEEVLLEPEPSESKERRRLKDVLKSSNRKISSARILPA